MQIADNHVNDAYLTTLSASLKSLLWLIAALTLLAIGWMAGRTVGAPESAAGAGGFSLRIAIEPAAAAEPTFHERYTISPTADSGDPAPPTF